MDRRQDSNMTSTPAGKSGPSAEDRYKTPAKMAENDLVSGGHGQAGSWRGSAPHQCR